MQRLILVETARLRKPISTQVAMHRMNPALWLAAVVEPMRNPSTIQSTITGYIYKYKIV